MPDDVTLLRSYAEGGDHAAFAELVRRNINFVYSVALRRVGGDRHLAEDIAQQVFVALARDARRLSGYPVLSGWLYRTTRNLAANAVRGERRRRHREQEAQAMETGCARGPSEADWNELAPVLEDAIDELSEPDRIAILLRFIDRRSFGEIGATLRLTDEAARKRVERALDKLRASLSRRGVASTASALAGTLMQHAVGAAPAELAGTIAGAALGTAGSAAGALVFMSMTKLQAGIAAALIAGGAVGLFRQQSEIGRLRETNADLQRQFARLTAEAERLAALSTGTVAEAGQPRVEMAARKSVEPAANPALAVAAAVNSHVASTGSVSPPAETEAVRRRKASLRQRYAPFFAQRGLTPEQGERFIELKLMLHDARQDLQDSVRSLGMQGDTPGVEALRSELTAPMWRELYALLGGKEGREAYSAFERASYYRVAFVDRLLPSLTSADAALSPGQVDQLVAAVAAHDRPQRVDPTSIGTQSQIDWDAVAAQTRAFLTPAQQAVLERHIAGEKSR